MSSTACCRCACLRLLTGSRHLKRSPTRCLSTTYLDEKRIDEPEDEQLKSKLLTPEMLTPPVREQYEQLKIQFPHYVPWRIKAKYAEELNSCTTAKSLFSMIHSLDFVERAELRAHTKRAVLQEYLVQRDAIKLEEKSSTIFLWTRRKQISTWNSNKLRNAYMFGKEVIIDCGFEKEFATGDDRALLQWELIDHVIKLYNFNKNQPEPYKIWLCNLDDDSELRAYIESKSLGVGNHSFIETTTKSYLEIFNRLDLVYLSPDARMEISDKQRGKKYIIGGLTDHAGQFNKFSLAKAKEDGVQCLKIAPTRYLNFRGRSIMPIHRVFQLLANYLETRDMATAVRASIPENRVLDEDAVTKLHTRRTASDKAMRKQFHNLKGKWDKRDAYIS